VTDPERDDSLAMALGDLDTYEAEVAKLNRQVEELRGQRDEARREIKRLALQLAEIQDVDREELAYEVMLMRPVVEAAEAWLPHAADVARCVQALADDTREPERYRDDYRAAVKATRRLLDVVDAWRAAQPDQKAPTDRPASNLSQDQGADDGAGTEGSRVQEGAQGDPGAFHSGRSWTGHHLEDACPCPKEPCGLVNLGHADPDCPQHPIWRGKTIRQSHLAVDCPGAPPAPADPAGLDAAIEAGEQRALDFKPHDWPHHELSPPDETVAIIGDSNEAAEAIVRAAAPHLRAAALNEAAAAFREDFDSRKLYLGAEFSVWLMQYQRAGRIGGGE